MDDLLFKKIVKDIVIVTKTKFALISKILDERASGSLETVAYWHEDKFVNNIRYAIRNTPCEKVVQGHLCFYGERVQELFPGDDFFKTEKIESYLGCPIVSSSGHVFGHISIFDTVPMDKEQELTTTIQAFAALASSEFERSISNQALIRSEEKFTKAFENSPNGILITSLLDGRILDANKGMCRITGFAREELIGQSVAKKLYMNPENRSGVIKKLKEDGEFHNMEDTFTAKNGETIHGLVSSVLMEIEGEACAFTIAHDVTEQKRIEAALKDSEEKFSKAIELSPNAVVLTRLEDGKILEANNACVEITGYQREELIGKTTIELNVYGSGERERLISLLREEGKYSNFESTLRRKDGIVRNTFSSGVVLEVQDEKCLFAIINDVTENKNIELALKQSEEQFRRAFIYAPMGMAIISLTGNILKVNGAVCRMLGYSESELIGKHFLEFTHHEGRKESELNFQKAISGAIKNLKIQKEYIHKEGHLVNVILSVSIVSDVDGVPHHLVAQLDDITLQKQAEKDLLDSENRFRTLYDATPAMFFTVNQDNSIASVNKFGVEKLGYQMDELIGNSVLDIVLPEDWEEYRSHVELCFFEKDKIHNWEIRKVKSAGTIIWSRESARVIDDIDGTEKLLIVSEDVTEAHQLSQQLTYQASHDALTGLVNRREFEIRLERLIHEDSRRGEEHACCYMDLDQFKVINDTCGHLAGDELLRQLGELFQSKVRKRDTLARLGGDEFGVLMENCSLSQAESVAHNLRKLVEEFQFVWADKRFSIGVSIGLVPINDSSGGVAEILSAADTACYTAKDAGRNRVQVFYTKDIDLAAHRGEMQWVSRINQALDQDRLRIYVQPIVSLSKKANDKKHYECLLRMHDESGKVILPGAFLPAAERYDLSVKLDRWVFESVYEWMARRSSKDKILTFCSINLSGHSLSNEEFLEFILDKLDEGEVSASNICFEITETVAISRLSIAIRFMETLKKKGCSFALDDFGSGVSSFGYLKNLPVDFLKIDGMFIRDMTSDPIDLAMVRSINEIGHLMGKKTIAEFVENEEIVKSLQALGVDYGQGYHLGKPRAIKLPVSKLGVNTIAKKKTRQKKRSVRTRKTDIQV